MDYDIGTLTEFTADEWDALLDSIKVAPVPRRIVRVPMSDTRRSYVLRRIAQGATLKEIGSELNVSVSMVSMIKNSKRG